MELHFTTVSLTSPETQYIDNPVPGKKNLTHVVLYLQFTSLK